MKYFRDRLRPQLKSKVNDPALCDKVDGHWTNNNCESVNHVLKQAIDWKSKPLTDLVTTLHTLVQGQFLDLRSAIIDEQERLLLRNLEQLLLNKFIPAVLIAENQHTLKLTSENYEKKYWRKSTYKMSSSTLQYNIA